MIPSFGTARASDAGWYRLATVGGYLSIVLILRAAGIASPPGVGVLLGVWTACALLGLLGLARVARPRAADRIHAALTVLDVTLLTLVHLAWAGGWWMGVSAHLVAAIYVHATLSRRLAAWLTAYIVLAFLSLLWMQDAAIARSATYLGVRSLSDRGALALSVALLGLPSLVIAAVVLRRFVGAIRRERRAYLLLLESAEDMIFTFDPAGRFVTINASAVRQSGFLVEEVLGRSFLPFIVSDDRERVGAHFARALEGVSQQYDARYRRRDGAVRWISCTNTAIRDGRRVRGVLAIVRDVTDRRQAEEEREQSLSLLQATFDSTADGILVVDRHRRIVSHNARFTAILGLREASLVGRSDEAPLRTVLGPTDDPAVFVARIEEIYASPDAESIDILSLADGRVLERYSRPQHVAGAPAGRVWSFRDVTAQVRAERSLRDSEQRYRMVLEQSTDGVAIFDEDGRIASVNPAFAQMLDWPPEALLGRSIAETVAPGELEATPVRFDLLRRGESVRRVRRFRRRDGSTLRVEVVSKRLPTGFFLALIRDITERERLESQLRQAQKMEAVGQLAGGVAHDFNNLLTVILSSAEMALQALPHDASAAADARADIEEVRRTAVRAASLTRQLLAFSRRQPMEARVVDPVKLLGELTSLLQRLITPTIELRLEVPPALWSVHADAGQLEQTIVNLVVNARDAMPGGGTLHLRARDESLDGPVPHDHGAIPAGDYVCLEVEDAGVGMTPEVLARIFEPFFSTKGPGKGTGLGLSTVYGIIKQHDGHILVDSRPGRGTRVRVFLPRTRQPATGASAAEPAPAHECGCDGTILLVDDEHAVLQSVRRMLERCGYTVLWARSPEEAIATEAAHRGRIDALVTDVVMPGMNGRALAEAICERRPGLGVLYLTGHTTDGELRRDVLGPNRQLLYKPFDAGSFLAAVRAVAEASRQRAGA